MNERVEQIKDEFRAATTVARVNEIAKRHRAEVADMEASPTLYPLAIQIKNLAAYRRWQIQTEGSQDGRKPRK
jgi:hypothetical protein